MSSEAPIAPVIHLQASLSLKVNLAFHQNAVPVLRELVVVNDGMAPLTDVVITLSSEPAFLKEKSWRLDQIGAQQHYHLRELDIALDPAFLGRLDMGGALTKVHERLLRLQEEARTPRAEAAAREATRAAAEAEAEAAVQVVEEEGAVEPVVAAIPPVPRRVADDLFQGADFALVPTLARNVTELPKDRQALPVFHEAEPAKAVRVVAPDSFFEPDYTATLLTMIQAVVDAEAPVRDDVLARRIARAHGWAKTGSRIFERVMAVTKRHFALVADGEHQFVWPQGVDTNHFPRFRRPTGDVVRPVDEIALPELAALAREVQEEGYEGYVALSAMAKLAGLQKLRQSSRQRFVGATSFNI